MPVLTRPAAPAPHTTKPPEKSSARSSWWRQHRFSLAVLTPSLILIGIFVYVFIGYSVRVSVSKWQGLKPHLANRDPRWADRDTCP